MNGTIKKINVHAAIGIHEAWSDKKSEFVREVIEGSDRGFEPVCFERAIFASYSCSARSDTMPMQSLATSGREDDVKMASPEGRIKNGRLPCRSSLSGDFTITFYIFFLK